MGKINKNQYEYRARSAAQRMEEQREIVTLTPEQHDQLAIICERRHWMHCLSGKELYFTSWGCYGEAIELFCNFTGEENNFKRMIEKTGINYNTDAFNKVMAEVENGDNDSYHVGLDEEGAQDKRYAMIDIAIEQYVKAIEEMNTLIEQFLEYVDETHGTSYCPTGALRALI